MTLCTYKAPIIKIVDTAKVIVNKRPDLYILLINELLIALIKTSIVTKAALDAGGSKSSRYFLKVLI